MLRDRIYILLRRLKNRSLCITEAFKNKRKDTAFSI